jgi:5'-nucleotidase
MRILVSNDDGVEALGIRALAEHLEPFGAVTVVAPARERSTTSHSLTLHKPLRLWEVAPHRFAVSGSPADCVYLAIHGHLEDHPDVVVSGINAGANLGTDVHYSGTVAAAREAALLGFKSFAFSLVPTGQETLDAEAFARAGRRAADVFRRFVDMALPPKTFINVNLPNVPDDQCLGVRVARQGFRKYQASVVRRLDPRGRPYYWVGGPIVGHEPDPESDCHAVAEGWIAVTPITLDATRHDVLDTMRSR